MYTFLRSLLAEMNKTTTAHTKNIFILIFFGLVTKKPTDSTTGTTSRQTSTTNGQTGTTSGQTSTKSGQASTMSDQTSFTSTTSDETVSVIIITVIIVFYLKTTFGKSLSLIITFNFTFS